MSLIDRDVKLALNDLRARRPHTLTDEQLEELLELWLRVNVNDEATVMERLESLQNDLEGTIQDLQAHLKELIDIADSVPL